MCHWISTNWSHISYWSRPEYLHIAFGCYLEAGHAFSPQRAGGNVHAGQLLLKRIFIITEPLSRYVQLVLAFCVCFSCMFNYRSVSTTQKTQCHLHLQPALSCTYTNVGTGHQTGPKARWIVLKMFILHTHTHTHTHTYMYIYIYIYIYIS